MTTGYYCAMSSEFVVQRVSCAYFARCSSLLQAMLVMPAFSSDDEDSDNESASANGKNEGKEDTGGNPLVQSSRSGESARSPIEGATDTVANDPGASLVPLPDKQEIFFTTTDFYLALRMHHMLAERLAAARRLCREAGSSRQPVVACPQEVKSCIARTSYLV